MSLKQATNKSIPNWLNIGVNSCKLNPLSSEQIDGLTGGTGTLAYNNEDNNIVYDNGTGFVAISGSGTGGAGATGVTGPTGRTGPTGNNGQAGLSAAPTYIITSADGLVPVIDSTSNVEIVDGTDLTLFPLGSVVYISVGVTKYGWFPIVATDPGPPATITISNPSNYAPNNAASGTTINGGSIVTLSGVIGPTGGSSAPTMYYAYANSTTVGVTGTAVVIKFDTAWTYSNTLSGYNTSTGVFTAPSTGWYDFTSDITPFDSGGGTYRRYYLQVEGSRTNQYGSFIYNVGGLTGFAPTYMDVAISALLYFVAGDTVTPKWDSGNATSNTSIEQGNSTWLQITKMG